MRIPSFAARSCVLSWGAAAIVMGGLACASTEKPAPAATTSEPPRAAKNDTPPHHVRVLLTTDEHGWLEPYLDRPAGLRRGGVIELGDVWARNEADAPTTLRLSGGDMWTGPYESTVLEGRPMLEAFHTLGYDASAIGNHEFDFGVRVLQARSAEAQFPLLAANVIEDATGQLPPWAKAFHLIERDGLTIGIVGLANVDTPLTTDRRHIVGLSFLRYAPTLRTLLPQVKAAGADITVVIVHDAVAVVKRLVPIFRDHHVNVVGAGHAHRSALHIDDGGTPSDTSDDVFICNAGPYLRSYCRMDLNFEGAHLVHGDMKIVPVARPLDERIDAPQAALVQTVAQAHAEVDAVGAEVLVEARRALTRADGSLGQFIVDTWLEATPHASVALTNAGGVRQDIAAGPLRVRDIASALPFNNYLMVVGISGAQLLLTLQNPETVVGGLTVTYRDEKGARTIVSALDAKGQPIDPAAQYEVVVNDFMYRGGDGYRFFEYDTQPEETAIDWREPLLRRLRLMREDGRALDVMADERMKAVP